MRPLLLCLLLLSCAASPDTPMPRASTGEVLWVPPMHKGWEVAAVTLKNNGTLEIFIAPEKTYQDVTTSARFIPLADDVTCFIRMRYVEVVPGLPPNGAAQATGWRDPYGLFEGSGGMPYARKVFQWRGQGPTLPEVRIYTNGHAYLFVIQSVELVKEVSVSSDT